MTWKSTAAASGLALVATWLASYAPVGSPRQPESTAPSAARTETAAAEIQREAERLHGRLKEAAGYRTPARNPFRFGERPTPAYRPALPPPPVAPSEAEIEPQPPTLRIALSGVGEEMVDGQVERTAFISSPENVYLVKVGDTVADVYKVTAIGAATVDLVRVADGSAVTLSLRP
jgi:hypothetical protein